MQRRRFSEDRDAALPRGRPVLGGGTRHEGGASLDDARMRGRRRRGGRRHHRGEFALRGHQEGLTPFNRLVVAFIVFGSLGAVLQTEAALYRAWMGAFDIFNMVVLGFFALEYVLRVYTGWRESALKGMAAFAFSFYGLLDALVLAGVGYALWAHGGDALPPLLLLRLLRLMNIFTLAPSHRYAVALRRVLRALSNRRFELAVGFMMSLAIVFAAAVAVYYVEGDIQPENFGSVPRALYWCVVTLSTVGYGDVVPLTTVGRMVASVISLASVAFIALPSAILAASFIESFRDGGGRGGRGGRNASQGGHSGHSGYGGHGGASARPVHEGVSTRYGGDMA